MRRLSLVILLAFTSALSAQNSDWARTTAAEAGLDAAKLQAMETAVQAGEFKKIGSVLVARHGKLAYEKYFEGDADTQRNTRSATKSITSILIGLAIQEKRLSGVDAKILALLPQHRKNLQNPDPRKEKITVEDFLTMSSALECDDWDDFSRGNEERMYKIEDWAQFILDLPIAGRLRIGDKEEVPKYGRSFSYCTGGVFTLSEVITKATGMGTDKYAQEKLFTPLGTQPQQLTWMYSPLGVAMTGGGLAMRSQDLLKIGQLYLNGGRTPDGRQLINADWVKASITPHAQINDHQEYGYLWWLETFKASDGKQYPAFYMTGNGGNKIVVIPSLDLVAVLTSTNYNTKGMHELTAKLLSDYILPGIK